MKLKCIRFFRHDDLFSVDEKMLILGDFQGVIRVWRGAKNLKVGVLIYGWPPSSEIEMH